PVRDGVARPPQTHLAPTGPRPGPAPPRPRPCPALLTSTHPASRRRQRETPTRGHVALPSSCSRRSAAPLAEGRLARHAVVPTVMPPSQPEPAHGDDRFPRLPRTARPVGRARERPARRGRRVPGRDVLGPPGPVERAS